MKKITKYLLVGLIIILCQLTMYFPNLYGFLSTPEPLSYTGQVSWFDPWDVNVYISAINWGKRGSLLFQNVYSTNNYSSAPIYTAYTILGKMAKTFSLSSQLTFHLSAIFFGFFFSLVVFKITKIVTQVFWERLMIFIIIIFGGGFGWLFFPSVQIPDLFTTGFTVLSSFQRAHEAISSSLYLATIYFIYLILEKRQKKFLFLSLGTLFLLCFFHPYMALFINIICIIYSLIKYRENKSKYYLFIPVFYFFSPLLYISLVWKSFVKNPGFSGLLLQQQQSSNPLLLVLAFGFLIPFIIISLFSKNKNFKSLLYLKIWFLTQFFLLYIPFGFKRLFIRNFFIPGTFLFYFGIRKINNKINYITIFIIIAFLSTVSSTFVFFKRIKETKTLNPWIYITSEERKAIDFLGAEKPAETGILSSYIIGNLIPATINKRVYLGHQFQTENFQDKLKLSLLFFNSQMTNEEALYFLKNNHIKFIFFGPEEKKLSQNGKLGYNFLRTVFENSKVEVYEINENFSN